MCGDGAVLAWKVEGRVGKKETIFATGKKMRYESMPVNAKPKKQIKKKNKNKH